MNFFNNFNKLCELRAEQLKLEKNVDTVLLKAYQKCPKNVCDFLLRQRKINRHMTESIHNASFFDKSDLYEKQLAYNQSVMDSILEWDDQYICDTIQNLGFYETWRNESATPTNK